MVYNFLVAVWSMVLGGLEVLLLHHQIYLGILLRVRRVTRN